MCASRPYWIEQASRYSEEDPNIHHQAEAKANGNVQKYSRAEARRSVRSGVIGRCSACVGDLCTGKGEKEEHRCPDKLSNGRYEVCERLVNGVWYEVQS